MEEDYYINRLASLKAKETIINDSLEAVQDEISEVEDDYNEYLAKQGKEELEAQHRQYERSV